MNPRPLVVISDFFAPAARAGGPVRSLSALAESDVGPRVWVLTGNRDLGEKVPMAQVRTGVWTRYGQAHVMYLDSRSPRSVIHARREIARLRPEYVYLNSMFAAWSGLLPLLLFRARLLACDGLVLAPRGQLDPGALSLSRHRKRLVLTALRWGRLLQGIRWHATSELEEDQIRRQAGTAADVRLVRPVPDIELSSAMKDHSGRPLRVVHISRLTPKKGLLDLLEALLAVQPPVALSIYGPEEDGEYASRCRRTAAKLPSRHSVIFGGPLEHPQVRASFLSADVFVLPTLGENFGHVVLESLAAGCPVVLPDTTPWSDAIRGGAGLVYQLGSTASLAEALTRLATEEGPQSRARSLAAGDAARAYIRVAEAQPGWAWLFEGKRKAIDR